MKMQLDNVTNAHFFYEPVPTSSFGIVDDLIVRIKRTMIRPIDGQKYIVYLGFDDLTDHQKDRLVKQIIQRSPWIHKTASEYIEAHLI